MSAPIQRRSFITLLGGAAATWPLAARGQQAGMPVVGYLGSGEADEYEPFISALREGLSDGGYVVGQNIAMEYRWAEGRYERLPALAADLVERQVAVIIATPSPAALAAKAATRSIPIVFNSGVDPVKNGLVASLNRPGGNLTGVSQLTQSLGPKRLELLRELIPSARLIGVLINGASPATEFLAEELQNLVRVVDEKFLTIYANNEREIASAFASFSEQHVDAILMGSGAYFTSQRKQIVGLAARYGIPAIYFLREFTEAGGLMSYGTSVRGVNHQLGVYAARILKGEKPADLPVMQPTKFELVINLKSAKALGLDVPSSFYWRADEVIE